MERRAKEERYSFKEGMEDEMDIFEEILLQRTKEETDIFKIGLGMGIREKTDVLKKGMEISSQEETNIFKKEIKGKAEKEMEQIGKEKIPRETLRDLSLSQHLDPSVVLTSSITVPGVEGVHHISCVTSERLWVSDYRRLLQVDNTGHVIREIEIAFEYYSPRGAHSVAEDGGLIFINGDKVQKMTLYGNINTLFERSKRLICIHSSRINGSILVGYRHGVFKCDMRGNNCTELGEYGFYNPTFITENKNGDIWVSDIHTGEVVVMDKLGRHRFNYKGQHQCVFYPGCICTDILGQVLVCDISNSSVHLLDQDGRFLCLLLTREHGLRRPRALCVDDKHNLYVGEMRSNTITVYTYLQETEDSKSSIVESK